MRNTGFYYYGTRYYNPRESLWLSVDPLAEKYPNIGGYTYCANNPINIIDPDGRKILFINGNWQPGLLGRLLGSDTKGKKYWGSDMGNRAQIFFNDYNDIKYIDGSSLVGGDMSGQDRKDAGYQYAKSNIKALTKGLKKNEVFNLVTHSEGAAYGAGIAEYLIEKGYKVKTIVHISADEGDEFTTPSIPMTYQIANDKDWVTGNKIIRGVDKSGLIFNDLRWDYVHGSTRLGNIFDALEDLKTVDVQLNMGIRNKVADSWYSQINSQVNNSTKFQYINQKKIYNTDGSEIKKK